MDDKAREAFEAWYFDKYMRHPEKTGEDTYLFLHARDTFEGFQAALQWAASQQAAEGWRPIESAPKNETIIIYQPRFKRITLSINDGFEYKEATHWMPLPPPPLAQGDSR